MDDRTVSYYNQFATDIAARFDGINPLPSSLLSCVFDQGMRVLDVGAGSGRDVAMLLHMGCDAYGAEPSAALRREAEIRHPELGGRLAPPHCPTSASRLAASLTASCAPPS